MPRDFDPETPGGTPVVLLCGGLGLRLRGEGDDRPKAVRPLADGRPLLRHVLDYYRSFGHREFVLCVGYGAAAIEESVAGVPGVTLVDSGVGATKSRRLIDAAGPINDRSFVFGYADVLSDFDLGRLAGRHAAGSLLTLVATKVRSRYGELEVDADSAVIGFEEKPYGASLISAGYFMGRPELLDLLTPDHELEEDLLPRLVDKRAVQAVVHDGLWLPFDTYKDFLNAASLMAERGCPWLTTR